MADFGFDSGMILNDLQAGFRNRNDTQRIINEQNRTKIDQQRQNSEDQLRDATVAKMRYDQQRQMSLADVSRQGAGDFTTPGAQALAAGGFGDEAQKFEEQAIKAQEAAIGLTKLHKEILVSKAGTVQTPDQAPGFLSSIPQSQRDAHGLPDPTDPNAFKKIQQFRASAITPEQQAQLDATKAYRDAELAIQRSKLNDIGVNPVTGGYYGRHGPLPASPQPTATGDAPTGGENPFPGLKPKDIDAKWKELASAVSTGTGRGKLAPQLQNRLFASERVKNAALDENGNIKNLDPTMLAEVAAGTASLLSNGSAPAEHTVQQFMPKGRGMGQANILEWLTNDPQGANQQGFIKQMVNLSNREEALLGTQIKGLQYQGVPQLVGLRKLNKTKFESILKGAGLDPGAIDENGLMKTGSAASAAHTPEELSAAKTWLSDPKNGSATQRAKVQAILEGK